MKTHTYKSVLYAEDENGFYFLQATPEGNDLEKKYFQSEEELKAEIDKEYKHFI